MSDKPATIDEYLATLPAEVQQVLLQIRKTLHKAVPGAGETISYAIPALSLEGKCFIYFSGYKQHTSIYPAPREHAGFKEELKQYKGGKGTVQFPLDKPLPLDLITRIAKLKAAELKERLAVKKKK